MRFGAERRIPITVALLGVGGFTGVLLTLLILLSLRPRDMVVRPVPTATSHAVIAPAPPRASATPASDLTMTIGKEVLVQMANKQAADTFEQYGLRDPQWTLGDGDNTVTLNAKGDLPAVGTDVDVQIVSLLVARNGVLQVDILSVALGGITVTGGALSGLAEDLNQDLAEAVDLNRFAVQDVHTSPEYVTLRMRVVGEL